jgi:hypothetical protein
MPLFTQLDAERIASFLDEPPTQHFGMMAFREHALQIDRTLNFRHKEQQQLLNVLAQQVNCLCKKMLISVTYEPLFKFKLVARAAQQDSSDRLRVDQRINRLHSAQDVQRSQQQFHFID